MRVFFQTVTPGSRIASKGSGQQLVKITYISKDNKIEYTQYYIQKFRHYDKYSLKIKGKLPTCFTFRKIDDCY